MCVCMYGCMSVCIYVCMHVCVYVRMYVCMYVCMYVVSPPLLDFALTCLRIFRGEMIAEITIAVVAVTTTVAVAVAEAVVVATTTVVVVAAVVVAMVVVIAVVVMMIAEVWDSHPPKNHPRKTDALTCCQSVFSDFHIFQMLSVSSVGAL